MSLFAARINSLNSLNNFRRGSNVVNNNISESANENYYRREQIIKNNDKNAYSLRSQIQRITNNIVEDRLRNSIAIREGKRVEAEILEQVRDFTETANGSNRIVDSYDNLIDVLENASKSLDTDTNDIFDRAHTAIEDFLDSITSISQGIDDIRSDIVFKINNATDEVNYLIQDLAKLNTLLVSTEKDTNEYASLENDIAENIKDISAYIDVRVFRDKMTGSYNVYSRDGSIFLADTQVATQFDISLEQVPESMNETFVNWSPPRYTKKIFNSVNNTNISGNLGEGILNSLSSDIIDSLSRLDSANHGYVRSFTNSLTSTLLLSEQGFDENFGGGGTPPVGNLPSRPVGAIRSNILTGDFSNKTINDNVEKLLNETAYNGGGFVMEFDPTLYTQIYIPGNLETNNRPFLLDGDLVIRSYKFVKYVLENTSPSDRIVDIMLDPALRYNTFILDDFVNEIQGVKRSGLSFNISFNKDRPTDPDGTTARSNYEIFYNIIQNILDQEVGMPDNIILARKLQPYVSQNVTIQPPLPNPPPSEENELTAQSVKTMITDIKRYLNEYPSSPSQSLKIKYQNWSAFKKHEFNYLLNEKHTNLLININSNPINTLPSSLGINDNILKDIVKSLEGYVDLSMNNGPSGTNWVEKFWYKKIFVPKVNIKTSDPTDLDSRNIQLNSRSYELIKDLLSDSKSLNRVLNHLKFDEVSFNDASSNFFIFKNKDIPDHLSSVVSQVTEGLSNEIETYQDLASNYSYILKNEVGVNIDTEINKLISLQNSYATSARSISTINEMFESLIKAVYV